MAVMGIKEGGRGVDRFQLLLGGRRLRQGERTWRHSDAERLR
ncbi:MAG: hypothetical protein NZU63_02230 [Gemmataceae bacterium]|nr:hypothetical protein [Gemmataceae bacterium]MDW8243313.1 hypothetical protein [Thermogemmata sp.]